MSTCWSHSVAASVQLCLATWWPRWWAVVALPRATPVPFPCQTSECSMLPFPLLLHHSTAPGGHEQWGVLAASSSWLRRVAGRPRSRTPARATWSPWTLSSPTRRYVSRCAQTRCSVARDQCDPRLGKQFNEDAFALVCRWISVHDSSCSTRRCYHVTTSCTWNGVRSFELERDLSCKSSQSCPMLFSLEATFSMLYPRQTCDGVIYIVRILATHSYTIRLQSDISCIPVEDSISNVSNAIPSAPRFARDGVWVR